MHVVAFFSHTLTLSLIRSQSQLERLRKNTILSFYYSWEERTVDNRSRLQAFMLQNGKMIKKLSQEFERNSLKKGFCNEC